VGDDGTTVTVKRNVTDDSPINSFLCGGENCLKYVNNFLVHKTLNFQFPVSYCRPNREDPNMLQHVVLLPIHTVATAVKTMCKYCSRVLYVI
jgi:hypothetical protein